MREWFLRPTLDVGLRPTKTLLGLSSEASIWRSAVLCLMFVVSALGNGQEFPPPVQPLKRLVQNCGIPDLQTDSDLSSAPCVVARAGFLGSPVACCCKYQWPCFCLSIQGPSTHTRSPPFSRARRLQSPSLLGFGYKRLVIFLVPLPVRLCEPAPASCVPGFRSSVAQMHQMWTSRSQRRSAAQKGLTKGWR